MRGTVLLIDREASRTQDAARFRADGLLVTEARDVPEALARADSTAVDVVVCAGEPGAAALAELRQHVDHATSIILVADAAGPAPDAGEADTRMPAASSADEVLYEIRRALILRRSGRRLPRNS